MRWFAAVALAAVLVAGCASAAGGNGGYVDPDYDFGAVRAVHVQIPIRVALRGSAGVGNRELEAEVAQALRTFFRRDMGWTSAARAAEADLVARFELTDWDQGQDGSRVGGAVELVAPATEEVVFRADGVYPNRFGPPSPGTPLDLTDELFRMLFEELMG